MQAASYQELLRRNAELEQENALLKAEVAALQERLAEVEKTLTKWLVALQVWLCGTTWNTTPWATTRFMEQTLNPCLSGVVLNSRPHERGPEHQPDPSQPPPGARILDRL